ERLTSDLADRARALIDEVEELGGMAKAIEAGLPKRRIAEAAARRQAAIDRGQEVVVGVNRYVAEDRPEIPIRDVDAHAVRERQRAVLAKVREERDEAGVCAALDALESAARDESGNLLALSIEAARARATVGEISGVLERVWGRHRASVEATPGIYGAAFEEDEEWRSLLAAIDLFRAETGGLPRMLVAKLGQDGHDRGAGVIASAFGDAGFEVTLSQMFSTPFEVARQAVEEGVHVIGVSSLAGGHGTLVPQLMHELQAAGGSRIRVVVGGIIPEQDHGFLQQLGVVGIFGPGTRIPFAAHRILESISPR
ncbi:MAG: methylmalonyl-CoA mutase family protein, partial [Pseudomonadales bacterium]|nr:methylmalonyl-CoA mutase family protein [Pseudomonadales bacterium]